jgi:hypothetical protein
MESVLAFAPDAVVVATGARASKIAPVKGPPMPIAGSEQDFVIDHEAALRGAESLGRRIVIIDLVGHIEGIGLGELLATLGKDVILAMPFPTPINLDRETIAYALPRAARAGVAWRPNTLVAAIGDHQVTLVDVLSRRMETIDDVANVVVRTHGVANDELYHALRERVEEVIRVGDAVAARPADRAIFDGHVAGRRL